MRPLCPHCHNPIEVTLVPGQDVVCPSCGSTIHLEGESTTNYQPCGQKLGRFELLAVVGHGAFGTVYRARDCELDRIVAVKVPRVSNLHPGQDMDRLLREARSVAQLRHPAIVPIHDVGQQDGLPYLVSDFIEGVTLSDLLTSRRLSFRESAQLLAEVAAALQFAHERGVVHRDVKPSNVMIDEQGRPHVMDFGLARRDAGEVSMTMTGQVLGTPAYMSPEQASGEGHQVDGRTDVYSLGVILYELLTGELPFRGNTRMLLHQVLHDEPRPPRRVNDRIPRDLETICLRAMAKTPGRRYATAGDFADDLRRFLAGEPIRASPVGKLERLGRWCRRNPAVAGLTATVALLLVAAAGIATAAALHVNAARLQAERDAKAAKEASNLAQQARDAAEEATAQEKLARADVDRALLKVEKERTSAEVNLYSSRITVAERYWSANETPLADSNLDECPLGLRQWEWHYLKRLCHSELRTVKGPSFLSRRGAAISPDGKRVASVCRSLGQNLRSTQYVKIWDAGSSKGLIDLEQEYEGRWLSPELAFSPDGRRLALVSPDRKASIWDAEEGTDSTGKELLTVKGHVGEVNGVVFSADGQRLATAGSDGTVRIWDGTTGKELLTVKGHVGEVNGVAFSTDGQRLATAGSDETVKVWEVSLDPKAAPATIIQPLHTLTGHKDHVLHVVFSSDGKRLASASRDNVVKVWDAGTGKELCTFTGHVGLINRVAFSTDGRRLATAGDDWTVRIWDASTGTELFALRGHAAPVLSLAFVAGGKELLSVSADGNLKAWDAATGGQGQRLPGDRQGLAFSRDGRQIATARGNSVTVWDLASSQEVLTVGGHLGEVLRIAFSSDGKRLGVASKGPEKDGKAALEVRLWDLTARQSLVTLTDKGENPNAAFGLDGQHLATVVGDKTVNVWNAATGNHLRGLNNFIAAPLSALTFDPGGKRLAGALNLTERQACVVWVRDVDTGGMPFCAKTLPGTIQCLAVSAGGSDGGLLAAGHDRTVLVWNRTNHLDLEEREPVLTLRGHRRTIRGLAFSPDGKRLASVSADESWQHGEVILWDLHSGREVLTINHYPGGEIAFDPSGLHLAVTGADGTVRILDGTPRRELLVCRDAGQAIAWRRTGQLLAETSSGKSVKVLGTIKDEQKQLPLGNPDRPSIPVHRTAFSPGTHLLATAERDHTIRIWNLTTGNIRQTCRGHTEAVAALAFSPDETLLASGGNDETVKVWDVLTGKEICTFSNHGERVLCLVFSPDGKTVASGGEDNKARLWDARTGKERRLLDNHGRFVRAVAFSPDGQWLATAGDEKTVTLWNLVTGKEVRTLVGHKDSIHDLAFSPDGKRLASAGWDRRVIVWDLTTGKEQLNLLGHEEGVTTVAFSPDGGRLATAGADRVVRVWNVKP